MATHRSTVEVRRSEGVRLCPSCHAGYIMGFDLHARCETCLGPQHAGLALTPRASCPYCAQLPVEEKRRRVDAFAALQEEEDDEASWAKPVSFTADLAGGTAGDAGLESSDSAPSIAGSPPGSPLFPLEDLEFDLDKKAASLAPAPLPPSSLPSCGALFRDLPDIIKTAAERKGVPMPAEPPAPAPSAMLGDIYQPEQASKQVPVWPLFPPLQPFLSEAGAEPGKLKAPVARYVNFTKVEGLTDRGCPSVPPLEPSLAAILLPKATFFGRRKPTPPSAHDQVTARVTDRSHQCAAQVAAAINNISLLASSMSSVAAQPDALSPELASEFGKDAAAILSLATAAAVGQSRIMAWMTVLQRNMWLHMSDLPEQIRKELLDGPISPDGLFGPLLQDAITHLQQASDLKSDKTKY